MEAPWPFNQVIPTWIFLNAPIRVDSIPGKGRALIATRTIQPGQDVLDDNPILLYPASYASLNDSCSCCFRALPTVRFKCPICSTAFFCSKPCSFNGHPFFLCRVLSRIAFDDATWSDDIVFLLCAYSLPAGSFLNFLSLHPSSSVPDKSTPDLHSQLISLMTPHILPLCFQLHLSLENTTALMSKKKMNSFTLIDPKSVSNMDVKPCAYAISLASLINHDCLPNVWYENVYIDNQHIFRFKALHEIKEGTEICISYVDGNMGYNERQRMLMEDYNFECKCEKCKRDAYIQSYREEGEYRTGEEQQGRGTRDVGCNVKVNGRGK